MSSVKHFEFTYENAAQGDGDSTGYVRAQHGFAALVIVMVSVAIATMPTEATVATMPTVTPKSAMAPKPSVTAEATVSTKAAINTDVPERQSD